MPLEPHYNLSLCLIKLSLVTDLELVETLGIIKCGENPFMELPMRGKSIGKEKFHFILTSKEFPSNKGFYTLHSVPQTFLFFLQEGFVRAAEEADGGEMCCAEAAAGQ